MRHFPIRIIKSDDDDDDDASLIKELSRPVKMCKELKFAKKFNNE